MSRPRKRQELLLHLEHLLRESSAQGILFSHAVAERVALASSDLECLDIIQLRAPVTAGQLAQATGLTTGAITGVIDRLEEAGYARRERDPKDRRKVLVRPLPALTRRILPHFQSLQRAMAGNLASYTDRELEFLVEFFTRGCEIMRAEIAKLQVAVRRER